MSEEAAWAVREFRSADFGDQRLDCRVVVAGALAARPNVSIPAARTLEEALIVLGYYAARWQVEVSSGS